MTELLPRPSGRAAMVARVPDILVINRIPLEQDAASLCQHGSMFVVEGESEGAKLRWLLLSDQMSADFDRIVTGPELIGGFVHRAYEMVVHGES